MTVIIYAILFLAIVGFFGFIFVSLAASSTSYQKHKYYTEENRRRRESQK